MFKRSPRLELSLSGLRSPKVTSFQSEKEAQWKFHVLVWVYRLQSSGKNNLNCEAIRKDSPETAFMKTAFRSGYLNYPFLRVSFKPSLPTPPSKDIKFVPGFVHFLSPPCGCIRRSSTNRNTSTGHKLFALVVAGKGVTVVTYM